MAVSTVMVFQGYDPAEYGFEKCRFNNSYNHQPIWRKRLYEYGNNTVDIVINGLGYAEVENNVDLQIEGSLFDMDDIDMCALEEILSLSARVKL